MMSEPSCIDLRPWKRDIATAKGGNVLLAYTNRGVKRHIAKLDGVEHHQHDDDAEVFWFPAELLDDVAAILKPKRLSGRAELTEKQREVLKRHAFQGGQDAPETRQLRNEGETLG